jgi:hypothetical protein
VNSLQQYWASLCVALSLSRAEAYDAGEVALILRRTSAFNLKPAALEQADIARAIQTGSLEFWLLHVSDRLGDYGAAGVMGFYSTGDELHVECWALSCRVLGKAIEYELCARLADEAVKRGCNRVLVSYEKTAQNGLAGDFLRSAFNGWLEPTAEGLRCRIPIGALRDLARSRGGKGTRRPVPAAPFALSDYVRRRWFRIAAERRTGILSQIAHELRHEADLRQALRSATISPRSRPLSFAAPRDPLEEVLAGIWAEVLQVDRVGIHDHFFDAGGHSLMLTQALARLNEILGVRLSLQQAFQTPTVAQLAQALTEDPQERARLHEAAAVVLEVTKLSDEEVELALSQRTPLLR